MGQRLEVAVALGGDPALIYAATAPLPPIPGLDEFALAGYLRGQRYPVVKGVTVDLEVPANAEFILEGYVDPQEDWAVEGPFGDHTGFYTLPELLSALSRHRRDDAPGRRCIRRPSWAVRRWKTLT